MRNINVGYGEIMFREDSDVHVQQQSKFKISKLSAVLEKVCAYVEISGARRSVSDKTETSIKMNRDFYGKTML
jgi:hypothetical protein